MVKVYLLSVDTYWLNMNLQYFTYFNNLTFLHRFIYLLCIYTSDQVFPPCWYVHICHRVIASRVVIFWFVLSIFFGGHIPSSSILPMIKILLYVCCFHIFIYIHYRSTFLYTIHYCIVDNQHFIIHVAYILDGILKEVVLVSDYYCEFSKNYLRVLPSYISPTRALLTFLFFHSFVIVWSFISLVQIILLVHVIVLWNFIVDPK